MNKFYFQVNPDTNIITDVINYTIKNNELCFDGTGDILAGYTEVSLPDTTLPAGINGGWYKLENGAYVEYPELKPAPVVEGE